MKPAPDTKWRDSMAYAPRFFVSMTLVLVAFAAVTYASTGSAATTAVQTLVCAVLIQLGYFGAVLYLTWRVSKARKENAGPGRPATDLEKAKPTVPVSMNEPGHSKP
ncbi:exopolysaccharide production repressor protein (plasmid) [Shinella sumterensis]|nr:exopolysaccharide production repressor protein [Shinella sumterensis]